MTFNISQTKIPTLPGVYLMKDKKGTVIYIGKAKNLKNRVSTYFLKNQNYKTQKLVAKICDIDYVLTDNENEAFLLESNLIKQYRPRFNIELKDQQRYTYLRLTNEKYPRLQVTRRTRDGKFLGKGKIFGPFTQGSSKLLTIGTLRKAFQIRICKRLPKKACLEYHLGNCEAPCEFTGAQRKYAAHVSNLESVLRKKDHLHEFTKKLTDEMTKAAKSQQYERAAEIRDTMIRLGSLKTQQKMDSIRGIDEEYFGFKTSDQTAFVMTLKKVQGLIRDSNKYSFELIGDNTFSNFLYQYYTTHKIPKNILVNELPDENRLLESILSEKAESQVHIIKPKKGERNDLIKLIIKNINLLITNEVEPSLTQLKDDLGLKEIPKIIECFDISNHGTDYAVGAMSRFVDAKPDKSGYRKFRIKTVKGRDDYAMISEIVKRRYLRLANENSEMPNLILIDGGKGQLKAAINSLKSLSIKVFCISLAKKNEEVYLPKKKNPIVLSKESESLKLLQHARDEAHRFGISYNRDLRNLVTI